MSETRKPAPDAPAAAASTPAPVSTAEQLQQGLIPALVVALGYALIGRFAWATAQSAASAGAWLWWPAGVSFAVGLYAHRGRPGAWVGLAAGVGLLAAAASGNAAPLLALGAGDLAAAALTAGFARRWHGRINLGRPAGVGLFLTLAAGAATAGASAAAAWALGSATLGSPSTAAVPLLGVAGAVAGRCLATVLVGLVALAWQHDGLAAARDALRRRANLALVVAVLVAAVAAWAPHWSDPLWSVGLYGLAGGLLAALVAGGGLAPATLCSLVLAMAAQWAAAGGVGTVSGAQAWTAWAAVAVLPTVVLVANLFTAHQAGVERSWVDALGRAGLGSAEWRIGRDTGRVSAQWRALSGTDTRSLERWLEQVHDDDRAGLREALDTLVAGTQTRAQREVRVRGGEGWRWLDVQWLAAGRDHHGKAAHLIATLADRSEQHEAQDHQRLSTNLFQHVHEGLLIADAQLQVLDVNPAYLQMLDMTRQEVIGSVPAMLRPDTPDPLARQQRLLIWSSLRTAGRWRGEIVERRRNGEVCTLRATISVIRGDGGGVRYHVLVLSDITEQRAQRDRLERQAHFDELTRLPNRARLMDLLSQGMRAADQDGHLLTVCYLDLDRFKPVNDRFGHAAGDRLLVELAGRLRSALRSSEFWSDAAGRLGGDEFLLLLRVSTLDEARLAVDRVLRVVAQPYVVDAGVDAVQVTASMGVTVYPIDRSDPDTLMRHADHAMYDAKQAGRNGYQFFDPEHRRRTEERVMAIGRVQEALDNREFVLHYQPKVDMRRGVVLGLEALLRWDHPQQGMIAPGQFLPLIENTGLSARIGDWVLAQALEHLAAWHRAGLDISVSVNVSARHLQESDFALRLGELLGRHSEPLAASLELEMLETAAHADIEATSALLARCRALGVRFALDDFGTGYSTLSYLKQLPVDVLKIDRSFVQHMLDDAQDRAIVEGVIGLARTFQCTVVAEGVESPAQARTLLDLGCHIGQGTGIAAPMPAAAVAAWIRDYRGIFAIAAAPAASAPRAAGAD